MDLAVVLLLRPPNNCLFVLLIDKHSSCSSSDSHAHAGLADGTDRRLKFEFHYFVGTNINQNVLNETRKTVVDTCLSKYVSEDRTDDAGYVKLASTRRHVKTDDSN